MYLQESRFGDVGLDLSILPKIKNKNFAFLSKNSPIYLNFSSPWKYENQPRKTLICNALEFHFIVFILLWYFYLIMLFTFIHNESYYSN